MRRSELLQGIREMRFISVQKRFRGGELSRMEAAEFAEYRTDAVAGFTRGYGVHALGFVRFHATIADDLAS